MINIQQAVGENSYPVSRDSQNKNSYPALQSSKNISSLRSQKASAFCRDSQNKNSFAAISHGIDREKDCIFLFIVCHKKALSIPYLNHFTVAKSLYTHPVHRYSIVLWC